MSKKIFCVRFRFLYLFMGFYVQNKSRIRSKYKLLSKKFLDFNDYQNPKSFLRQPQFEALEMYVFLKEYQENKKIHDVFTDWYEKRWL